jgi:membrane protein
VESQLNALAVVLPAEALKLLSDQMYSLIHAPPATLGIGLLVSLMLALWSAMSGTSMLMQALTIACNKNEDRGIVSFYLTAVSLTACLMPSGLLSLLLVAVTPALLDRLPFPDFWREALSFIRWPVLARLAITGLGIVYRFAPPRYKKRLRWIRPSAIAATLLWIVDSAGFSPLRQPLRLL